MLSLKFRRLLAVGSAVAVLEIAALLALTGGDSDNANSGAALVSPTDPVPTATAPGPAATTTATSPAPTATPTFSGGERYGGFLLLQYGEPLPSFVIPPTRWRPRPGIVEDLPLAGSSVVGLAFPVYALGYLLPGIREGKIQIVRHPSGEIHRVYVIYEQFNTNLDKWVTAIYLAIAADVHTPYPVWPPVKPSVNGVRNIQPPEKVSFTPTLGLRFTSKRGFSFMWVEQNLRYWFIFGNEPDLESANEAVLNLKRLS